MKYLDLKSKFGKDIVWNLLSYAGIVGIGILINILIINFYDESSLGVFNQVYAVYIFLSQLAVGGVHLSVQYFVPKYSYSKQNSVQFFLSALLSSLITSVFIILIGYLLIPFISKMLNSSAVGHSLYLTLWGLLFFSFNKVILSYFNGLRRMKEFAIFQFCRFLFMLLTLLFYILWNYSTIYLSSILALAELILFVIMTTTLIKEMKFFRISKRFNQLFLLQFSFGNKALLGNFLLDLNTKVDVFMLGIFLEDALVGVYSFSATMFEGFSQISVLLRNNFNPILTRAFSKKLLFEKVLFKNLRGFYKIIILLGTISIIFFPVIPFVFNVKDILAVSVVYGILCIGFILTGGYHVLLMIFNQIGYPKLQTILIFLVFISNVIFNLIFIPFLGIYGAAIGTSLSFLVQMFFIKYFLKVKFDVIIK